ncbi:hypothetical protein RKE30_04620 [Streptomyces sp. Li-HN-5-11]|uniref:hypothetical protein n=1 Tax=Streptomyces sp. Li-HN-5-11 TaxID=3075432 RepID=UPI0028A5B660|nr:hypothetical protein [Streptomyces sp. Li-HN-5-11]WNM29733.1 hypothetical protein RKE30_04620 [Streptomyces sp. Li-HN-5-11]
MAPPAVLSGAALRVVRTAAGRRALQLGLLVAALFGLGFLCGEQAHAAEEVPTAPPAAAVASSPADGVRSLTKSAVAGAVAVTEAPRASAGATGLRHVARPAARPEASQGGTDEVVRPGTDSVTPSVVTDSVVRSVTARIVRPVGGLVGSVAGGAAEGRAELPPVVSLPVLPVPSGSPSPSLPGLPGLPGLSEQPGHLLPAPVTFPPQQHQPGGAATSATGGDGADPQPRTTTRATRAIAFGPRSLPGAPTAGGIPHVHRVPRAPHAPAHQAPNGDPNGALGDHSASGYGSSRHVDAHAVTHNDRAPLRLVPGAAACADASGTRDRHRDIPVFPG